MADAPCIERCTRRIGVSTDLTTPPTPATFFTDPLRSDTDPVSTSRIAPAAARLASRVLSKWSASTSTSSSGSTGMAPPSLRYRCKSTVDMASSEVRSPAPSSPPSSSPA